MVCVMSFKPLQELLCVERVCVLLLKCVKLNPTQHNKTKLTNYTARLYLN